MKVLEVAWLLLVGVQCESTVSAPMTMEPHAPMGACKPNNMIAFAGVFIAISSVILALVGVFAAIAAFLRVRETKDIINLKDKFEKDINEINSRADKVEKKFDESSQNLQNLLNRIAEQAKEFEGKNREFEEQLKQLDKRIDSESQKFIEAHELRNEVVEELSLSGGVKAVQNQTPRP